MKTEPSCIATQLQLCAEHSYPEGHHPNEIQPAACKRANRATECCCHGQSESASDVRESQTKTNPAPKVAARVPSPEPRDGFVPQNDRFLRICTRAWRLLQTRPFPLTASKNQRDCKICKIRPHPQRPSKPQNGFVSQNDRFPQNNASPLDASETAGLVPFPGATHLEKVNNQGREESAIQRWLRFAKQRGSAIPHPMDQAGTLP